VSGNDKKNLKQLTRKWYKKLKDSGFDDIEEPSKSGYPTLKFWGSDALRQRNSGQLRMESVQRYYELAGQFFWDANFDTSAEKRIWKMHADGVSGYEIASKLKMSKSVVYRVIDKLAREMLSQRVGTDDRD
jgi:hypothetical protein